MARPYMKTSLVAGFLILGPVGAGIVWLLRQLTQNGWMILFTIVAALMLWVGVSGGFTA